MENGADLTVLQDQLRLMRDRLVEEGNKIPDEPIIIDYDNGGGQNGIRENPFYPAYEKLLSSYVKTLAFVKGEGGEIPKELPSLDDLRKKYKIAK